MEYVDFDEAKERLDKTDDELQAMIKSGDIRAFRDEGTWKFRKDDVDAMAGDVPEETPAPEGVSAPEGGGESFDLAGEQEGEEEDAGDTLMSIDADILFAEEEEVPADSAAETWIAADTEGVFPGEEEPGEERSSGVEEAMTAPEVEPAPLALNPETEESSLQDVLSEEEIEGEEVYEEEPVIAVDTESGLASVISGTSGAVAPSRTRVVTVVEPPAHHGAFTVLMGVALVALAAVVAVVIGLLQGWYPGMVEMLGEGNNPLYLIVAGVFIIGIVAVIGVVLESQRRRREAAGQM